LADKNARPTADELVKRLHALKKHYEQNLDQWNQACTLTHRSGNNDSKSMKQSTETLAKGKEEEPSVQK
jgi:hypothetical protein